MPKGSIIINCEKMLQEWMRSRKRPRNPVRDSLLRWLNREIYKTFHSLFNDSNKCAIAILADIYANQLAELSIHERAKCVASQAYNTESKPS